MKENQWENNEKQRKSEENEGTPIGNKEKKGKWKEHLSKPKTKKSKKKTKKSKKKSEPYSFQSVASIIFHFFIVFFPFVY